VNRAAALLVARLIGIQLVAWGAKELLVVLFAPRLLLLDPSVVAGSGRLVLWDWVATASLVTAATVLIGRQVRKVLMELAVGATQVDPRDVHHLYDVPWRLVAIGLAGSLGIAGATLFAPLRPDTNDLYTQVELALLALTMASVAALPAYVMMRASVARVFELVPVTAAGAAIELLGTRERRMARVRRRLLMAVVAPVAFVALGASLLVHAHLRAFDTSSRRDDAAELAQGVIDAPLGDPRGRKSAIDAARAFGFDVEVWRSGAPFSAERTDEGKTVLQVPLSTGHAVVRFRTARLSPGTSVYVGLALVAIAIAGILGWRTGGAFADDVGLAQRELEDTGVADVDARAATERMRGLFLASMSHDLKAPLNAILGFAGLVARGPLTEGQSESVAIIEQRGLELLYLIDTILDAARVEAGELTVSPEWTRVGDVVMPAILDARQLTEGMNVEIVGEIQPGVPRALADPARLAQAVTAIILVASRFAEKGDVTVRASIPAGGDQLRIDVDVTGRGIAPADREKIFDAFKHPDRARRHGSLGLGPWLARSIVELHGGGIDIETTEGGGTVFRVWVPSERSTSRS
jgi:signal transduction histidine kinase